MNNHHEPPASHTARGHFSKGYTPWNKPPPGTPSRILCSFKLKRSTMDKIRLLTPRYQSQGKVIEAAVELLPES